MQCPKCGHDNRSDASACSSCYYDLSSTTSPVVPPPVSDATRVQAPAPVPQPAAAQPVAAQTTVMGGPPPTYQPDPAPGTPGAYPGPGAPAPQYMEYIGFWPRVAAYLIDGLVLTVVFFALALPTGAVAAFMDLMRAAVSGDPNQTAIASQAFTMKSMLASNVSRILTIVYFIGMNATRGATFGKMALGVKIVKEDGSPIGVGVAIGRYLLQTIFAMLTCGGLSYIAVAVSPTYQGWHDKIMGTVVTRAR